VTPSLEVLGLALLHSSWQGLLVLGVTEPVLVALDRAEPAVRYRVASAALASQVALFLLTGSVLALDGASLPTSPIGGPSLAPAWTQLVASCWGLGATVQGARTGFGAWAAHQLQRRSIAAPPGLSATFARLRDQLGLPTTVTLRLVPDGWVPMTLGALRPVVLVPASILTRLTPAQLESILLHELVHVSRLDWVANLAQAVAEVALFHHPATWWLSARIRHERELCCDAAVVASSRDAFTYARALVQLEDLRSATLTTTATGGNLMDRITRLVDPTRPRHRRRWSLPAVALGGIGLVVVSTATASPALSPPPDVVEEAPTALPELPVPAVPAPSAPPAVPAPPALPALPAVPAANPAVGSLDAAGLHAAQAAAAAAAARAEAQQANAHASATEAAHAAAVAQVHVIRAADAAAAAAEASRRAAESQRAATKQERRARRTD
jgi:D-alanyl-D-alanine endopeptidase (penicillin-binding protein 7)